MGRCILFEQTLQQFDEEPLDRITFEAWMRSSTCRWTYIDIQKLPEVFLGAPYAFAN